MIVEVDSQMADRSPLPEPHHARVVAELQSLIEKAERYRCEHLAARAQSAGEADRAANAVLAVIEDHLKLLRASLAFVTTGELLREPGADSDKSSGG